MAHEDWGHDGVDDEGEHDRAIQSAREDALVHLGQDEEEQHAAQDVEESEDEADVGELGARLGGRQANLPANIGWNVAAMWATPINANTTAKTRAVLIFMSTVVGCGIPSGNGNRGLVIYFAKKLPVWNVSSSSFGEVRTTV